VPYKLLLVDDDSLMLAAMKGLLQKNGYTVETAKSGDEGIEKIRQNPKEFGVVILDYRMEGKDGAATAAEILTVKKELYILIHSADESQLAATSTWRAGAVTFIEKAHGNDHFLGKVREWCKKYEDTYLAATQCSTDSENESLISKIGMTGRSEHLAGHAKRILSGQFDDPDASVMILGENGTGKEVLAQAIHRMSSRKNSPFVAVNCGTLQDNLVESELFGHEKGAFTVAIAKKTGKMVSANYGTFFLDEIGETNPIVQVKLLRAIQEKLISPVGSTRDVPIDVRIISATNVDLESAIQKGRFRKDLYFRLKIVTFSLLSLRDRPEDIEPLVLHFCDVFNRKLNKKRVFMKGTISLLEKYPWPGNVRELENEVMNLVMFSANQRITPDDLDRKYIEWADSPLTHKYSLGEKTDDFRKSQVEKALRTSRSQREAAKRLGMAFSTFRDLLKRYGMTGGGPSQGAM
jgi:DNA-binding NtrC family response regulator